MTDVRRSDVTELLVKVRRGDQHAADALFEAVYVDLRHLARRYLRDERPNHTLQPTALVHEAYVRLIGGEPIAWQNRAQFFSVAAQVMRHVLVDHARRHRAGKRHHRTVRVSIEDVVDQVTDQNIDLVSLDDALERLTALDAEQGRVVELRYFGGLTIPEIADVLDVAEITVSRRWKTAKAWLRDALTPVER